MADVTAWLADEDGLGFSGMSTGEVGIPFHAPPPPWGSTEEREFPIPLTRVEQALPSVIEAALGIRLIETAPCRWWGKIRIRRSLFDGTLRADAKTVAGDDQRTLVELRFQFVESPAKLALFMWLVSTLIGIPIASRWRARSTRTAQRRMSQTFVEVWAELGVIASKHTSAYR